MRLASDQVRFYRTGAALNTAHAGGGGYRARAFGPGADEVNEPLRVDQVPTLVFSEIMRDVDLFVGVGSIGNDPAWQDGGRETRYGEYWRNYSFGELSATAISRRETLERLIPRLKIADKCMLSDRFLLVQGTRRRQQDSPRLGEHSDGAERSVPVHRAGCEGTCRYSAGVPAI